jgi:hypothetical protein
MATYAVVYDGFVVNTIVADTQEIATQVAGDGKGAIEILEGPNNPGIGWAWDGFAFTSPEPIIVVPPTQPE